MAKKNNLLINDLDIQLNSPQHLNLTFYNEDKQLVGKLSWENGMFELEGETEESARIFFDIVIRHVMGATNDE